MNDITPKEAIANLNHLYGVVSPDMQRSLDVAIKALERPQGDCISREWVKTNFAKEFFKALESGKDTSFEVFGTVKKVIDNAPTVEPICPYLSDNEVKQPCLNSPCERPKGDWRDNLIEVFRQSAEVGGDTFHLFEIERIINGEPI